MNENMTENTPQMRLWTDDETPVEFDPNTPVCEAHAAEEDMVGTARFLVGGPDSDVAFMIDGMIEGEYIMERLTDDEDTQGPHIAVAGDGPLGDAVAMLLSLP